MILIILNLLWAGAVLGISFLESWVKFRAKTVTRPIALDIGRTVFNAFHKAQMIFLIIILIVAAFSKLTIANWSMLFLITIILLIQILFLFPALNKRIDLIIKGDNPKKSFVHGVYGILEILKLGTLIFLSVSLFA